MSLPLAMMQKIQDCRMLNSKGTMYTIVPHKAKGSQMEQDKSLEVVDDWKEISYKVEEKWIFYGMKENITLIINKLF